MLESPSAVGDTLICGWLRLAVALSSRRLGNLPGFRGVIYGFRCVVVSTSK